MKAEVKAQWIADLRSGDFVQASGRLKTTLQPDTRGMGKVEVPTIGYCCLGVLLERQEPQNWGHPTKVLTDAFTNYGSADGQEIFTLEACKRYGLDYNMMEKLAGLNDEGKTFVEIADLIEVGVPVDA